MMNVVYYIKIAIISIIVSLTACSGSTDSKPNNRISGPTIAKPCEENASYSITWKWAPINTESLNGFRIYYGNFANLTKYNALGYIILGTGSQSASFKPSDYNIADCTNTYVGISATGSQPESSLAVIKL